MATPASALEALSPALPLMASLFGGGALVTLLGTLLAVRLQTNREHERWLAGKRLEAYYGALRFMKDARTIIVVLNRSAQDLGAGVDDLQERMTASAREVALRDPENWETNVDASLASFREEVADMSEKIAARTATLGQVSSAQRKLFVAANEVMLPMTLLGPATVGKAGDKLLETLSTEDDDEGGRALQRYIDAMRKVLRTVR